MSWTELKPLVPAAAAPVKMSILLGYGDRADQAIAVNLALTAEILKELTWLNTERVKTEIGDGGDGLKVRLSKQKQGLFKLTEKKGGAGVVRLPAWPGVPADKVKRRPSDYAIDGECITITCPWRAPKPARPAAAAVPFGRDLAEVPEAMSPVVDYLQAQGDEVTYLGPRHGYRLGRLNATPCDLIKRANILRLKRNLKLFDGDEIERAL